MDALLQPELWAALLTLTALEIVLGIDNIIFISIIVSKLPAHQQARARTLGLAGALFTRVGLLFSLAWMASLVKPLFSLMEFAVSGRDLVLFFGGLFLLWKATTEIHESLEGGDDEGMVKVPRRGITYLGAIVQIMILDIVFSLDSVITAVGMTDNLPIMVTAITIAIITMMFFAGPLSRFVDAHPTVKVLALAFLIMVGGALVAESLHFHIPKGYLYFAMAFSVGVEMVNLKMRKSVDRRRPRSTEPPESRSPT
ncbi:TerC family protein [Panacagrimonas sp.]|uniref:TerC family protein n=1 Tax=Panacagrimonas sp. TaxID=2480088 RepID=UPI003B5218BE